MSDQVSLADIALLSFIRQLAKLEHQWYLKSPYLKVMVENNVWVGISE
jgi:hypothetical protein